MERIVRSSTGSFKILKEIKMNKTISINIGGFVFNIEENAYQKLYYYLEAVKKNFNGDQERDEIMDDIESRIAEIFQSRLSAGKQVIIEKDVDEMINVMGRPEDYASDEFNAGAGQKKTSSEKESAESAQFTGEKRLYRDTENATLGGVCSGLSHYFNIDVTVVRVLFVVFAFIGGFSLLVYVLMLLLVPEAKSTTEKLNMRGQSINLDSIKQHFNKIKNDISENARSGKFKRSFNTTFNRGVKAGSHFVNTFSRVLGLAFVMGGIFAVILLLTVLFGNSGFFPVMESEHVESLPDLLQALYPGDSASDLVFIALILVTMIPVIAIIITGTRLLFNIKRKPERQSGMKALAISTSVLWLIAVAVLIITGIDLGMNFRNESSLEYAIPLNDSANVLYVDVAADDQFSNHISYGDVWHDAELLSIKEKHIYCGYPELYVMDKKDSGNFEIVLYKKSNGLTTKDAIEKAEHISYPLTLTGNRLVLPAYFTIPSTDKLRNQRTIVELRVPLGKQVKLGNNIDRINVSVTGGHKYYHNNYVNTTWERSREEMRCLECKRIPRHLLF